MLDGSKTGRVTEYYTRGERQHADEFKLMRDRMRAELRRRGTTAYRIASHVKLNDDRLYALLGTIDDCTLMMFTRLRTWTHYEVPPEELPALFESELERAVDRLRRLATIGYYRYGTIKRTARAFGLGDETVQRLVFRRDKGRNMSVSTVCEILAHFRVPMDALFEPDLSKFGLDVLFSRENNKYAVPRGVYVRTRSRKSTKSFKTEDAEFKSIKDLVL